jgi:monoamine oxidase
MNRMKRPHVIVIGAGAAGLTAAAEISSRCDVTILETLNRTGGRVWTNYAQGGENIIEAGAEFIHGETPLTNRFIEEAGLQRVKLEGKMLRKEGKEWREEEDMIEGWDELVEKMKGQRKDMTMHDFMMKHFADEKYAGLRRHIKAFVGGFDVADTKEVSVQSLYREWSKESDQFRIKTGYGSLLKFLEDKCTQNGCKIFTRETVRQIDWEKDDVTVYTAAGNKYHCNKVLITIPISILRDVNVATSINITPPVDEYVIAARQVGYGTVIKVIFEFSEKIWKEKTGFIFSNEMIPTWWTQHPADNNLLTGWAGGPAASKLSQHTDDELLEIGITSLSYIFDIPAGELKKLIRNSYIFNWSRYEQAVGAYSFSTPDSSAARKVLNTPLADTLFFAGEGLYDGEFSGTVEAALTSGSQAASSILKGI